MEDRSFPNGGKQRSSAPCSPRATVHTARRVPPPAIALFA
jgi:hypothetical protein